MLAKMQWLWIAVCGVALSAVAGSVLLSGEVKAYGGASQVNTMSDPYTYPSVPVCCAPKPKPVKKQTACEKDPDSKECECEENPKAKGCESGEDSMDVAWVDCGVAPSGDDDFDSLQEAVDNVVRGGIVRVRSGFPGADCRETCV
jgi:hypothetical protein